jgi:hypothetical protein
MLEQRGKKRIIWRVANIVHWSSPKGLILACQARWSDPHEHMNELTPKNDCRCYLTWTHRQKRVSIRRHFKVALPVNQTEYADVESGLDGQPLHVPLPRGHISIPYNSTVLSRRCDSLTFSFLLFAQKFERRRGLPITYYYFSLFPCCCLRTIIKSNKKKGMRKGRLDTQMTFMEFNPSFYSLVIKAKRMQLSLSSTPVVILLCVRLPSLLLISLAPSFVQRGQFFPLLDNSSHSFFFFFFISVLICFFPPTLCRCLVFAPPPFLFITAHNLFGCLLWSLSVLSLCLIATLAISWFTYTSLQHTPLKTDLAKVPHSLCVLSVFLSENYQISLCPFRNRRGRYELGWPANYGVSETHNINQLEVRLGGFLGLLFGSFSLPQ